MLGASVEVVTTSADELAKVVDTVVVLVELSEPVSFDETDVVATVLVVSDVEFGLELVVATAEVTFCTEVVVFSWVVASDVVFEGAIVEVVVEVVDEVVVEFITVCCDVDEMVSAAVDIRVVVGVVVVVVVVVETVVVEFVSDIAVVEELVVELVSGANVVAAVDVVVDVVVIWEDWTVVGDGVDVVVDVLEVAGAGVVVDEDSKNKTKLLMTTLHTSIQRPIRSLY